MDTQQILEEFKKRVKNYDWGEDNSIEIPELDLVINLGPDYSILDYFSDFTNEIYQRLARDGFKWQNQYENAVTSIKLYIYQSGYIVRNTFDLEQDLRISHYIKSISSKRVYLMRYYGEAVFLHKLLGKGRSSYIEGIENELSRLRDLEEAKEFKETLSTPQLKWTGTKNVLPTIFYILHEKGLIKGKKADIEEMIHRYFEDEKGGQYSMNQLRQMFKPDAGIKDRSMKVSITIDGKLFSEQPEKKG